MKDHGKGFNFHSGVYKLRCPLTSCSFVRDEENVRDVYYYNAEIIVGGVDDRFGDELINVILCQCEDYTPMYVNYIELAATFIRNGVIPMLCLPSMINKITEEDIKWYIDVPSSSKKHTETYDEVKLKWNKQERLYEDAKFIRTDIKVRL